MRGTVALLVEKNRGSDSKSICRHKTGMRDSSTVSCYAFCFSPAPIRRFRRRTCPNQELVSTLPYATILPLLFHIAFYLQE